MNRQWWMRYKYSVIFIAFLICFYGYHIGRSYGFIFFPDEFGYWTYAAQLSGYDWSDIVSLGSYYSYGYSLILFPIFQLCKDAVMAYRVAVTCNFILLGVVYFLLLYLAKRLNEAQCKVNLCLATAVAVFYPSWLFYARTTMVETVLMATFVVICVLLYRYLEKNKWSTLIWLVLCVVYIHFLHMRAIGVLIAGVITLVIYFLCQSGKWKQFFLLIVFGIVVLCAGFALKDWVQGLIYTSAEEGSLQINDYAGQLDKVWYLFSEEGMKNFISGLAGKILYLGIASFGISYWGLWKSWKETYRFFRAKIKKEDAQAQSLFYLFVLLTTIGETLINTIYNVRPIRVDSVTYGRYHEFVMPMLMILGIVELLQTTRKWRGTFGILLLELPLVLLLLESINRYELTNMHGYVMVGMSYLQHLQEFEANRFFWQTYVMGAVLTVVVALMITIAQRFSKEYHLQEIILVLLIVMEFVLSVRASTLYIEPSTMGAYRDSVLVDYIQEIQSEKEDSRLIYIHEEEKTIISILQFMLRDEDIEVVNKKESINQYTAGELTENDLIILDFDSSYTKEVEKYYKKHILHGHFVVYYN